MVKRSFPLADLVSLTTLGAAAAGWTKSASHAAPRFRKDALGNVHVTGELTATGASTTTFFAAGTLPVGCRPLGSPTGTCHYLDDSAGTETVQTIYAGSDGSLLLVPPASVAADDSFYFTISFPAGI